MLQCSLCRILALVFGSPAKDNFFLDCPTKGLSVKEDGATCVKEGGDIYPTGKKNNCVLEKSVTPFSRYYLICLHFHKNRDTLSFLEEIKE